MPCTCDLLLAFVPSIQCASCLCAHAFDCDSLDHELPPPFNVLQLQCHSTHSCEHSGRERLAWLVWLLLSSPLALGGLSVCLPLALSIGLAHRFQQTGASLTWIQWLACTLRYVCAWLLGMGLFVLTIPVALLAWLLNVLAALACSTMRLLCCCFNGKCVHGNELGGTDGRPMDAQDGASDQRFGSEDIIAARQLSCSGSAPLAKFRAFVNGGRDWARGRYRVVRC